MTLMYDYDMALGEERGLLTCFLIGFKLRKFFEADTKSVRIVDDPICPENNCGRS